MNTHTHSFDGDTSRLSKPVYCALSKRTATSHSLLNKSRHTLLLWLKHTISIVIYPWDYCTSRVGVMSACPELWGGSERAFVYLFFPTSMCHLAVYVCILIYWYLYVCVSTRVGEGTWGYNGSVELHHALTCFAATMCAVWMSQQPLPPSSPSSPNATVRTPLPLDSQTWTRPMHRITTNQFTRFPYANDTEYWLLNIAVTFQNCQSENQKHWHSFNISVYLLISSPVW